MSDEPGWPEGLPRDGVRLGPLLRCRVRDADGRRLGKVHDAVARRSGRLLNEAAGQAWVLDRLLVAPSGLLERLGLSPTHPPAPRVIRALARQGHTVRWSDVASRSGRTLHLRVTREELDRRSEG